MSERAKLKLEFEILTLANNIETMHRLGKCSIELQNRLNECRTKLQELTYPVVDEGEIVNNATILVSS
jgi:hypothetical protein